MIYEKALPRYIKGEKRYANTFEYMFILSKGTPNTFNPIIDVPNKSAGKKKKRDAQMREPTGERTTSNSYCGQPKIVASHSKRSNIWRYTTGTASAPDFKDAHKHPAIFPLKLAQDHILTWTNEGDLVVDPMAGSGTTLKAAVNLNRNTIGIEIYNEYVELIKKRMANPFTPKLF